MSFYEKGEVSGVAPRIKKFSEESFSGVHKVHDAFHGKPEEHDYEIVEQEHIETDVWTHCGYIVGEGSDEKGDYLLVDNGIIHVRVYPGIHTIRYTGKNRFRRIKIRKEK